MHCISDQSRDMHGGYDQHSSHYGSHNDQHGHGYDSHSAPYGGHYDQHGHGRGSHDSHGGKGGMMAAGVGGAALGAIGGAYVAHEMSMSPIRD